MRQVNAIYSTMLSKSQKVFQNLRTTSDLLTGETEAQNGVSISKDFRFLTYSSEVRLLRTANLTKLAKLLMPNFFISRAR